MKTIIFDIDGTLTNMWPLEHGSGGNLPVLLAYPLVGFIKENHAKYRFLYATGGNDKDTKCALEQLGILEYFDLGYSFARDTSEFSKSTGIPFKKQIEKFPDAVLITDSLSDVLGAEKVGLASVLVNQGGQMTSVQEVVSTL